MVYPTVWGSQKLSQVRQGGKNAVVLEIPESYRNHSIEDVSLPNNQAVSSREVRSVSASSTPTFFNQQMDQEEQYYEHDSHEFYHFSPFPWFPDTNNINSSPPSMSSSLADPPQDKSTSSSQQSADISRKMKIKISAFGRDLYLLLKRDNHFLSPGFVVEERRQEKRESLNTGDTDRNCYYSGTVLRHPGSFASFSTCGGLVSFLCISSKYNLQNMV